MQPHEEPTFDGTEATEANPAVKDEAVESAPAPAPAQSEEDSEPVEVPRVKYTGSANVRMLTRQDLSGEVGGDDVAMLWAPGTSQPWAWFCEMAGSEERAREVIRMQAHEFELLGVEPEPAAEEFSVGGAVTE